jgi:hypothetical protein
MSSYISGDPASVRKKNEVNTKNGFITHAVV